MKKEFKLNANILGHKTGETIKLKVDEHGIPTDRFARYYWKSAKIDNCMEIVKSKKKVKKND